MDAQKHEYFRPALIAGAVAGLLSGLPVLALGNCICCLWIVGGAAMAVKMLSQRSATALRPSDGALEGALTGIVAAVVHTVLTLVQRPDMETVQRVFNWLSSLGIERPANLDGVLARTSAFQSTGWVILSLFITAAIYTVVGALGGIIGVSLFGKKALPPAAAPPAPAAPPAAPPGPPDAA